MEWGIVLAFPTVLRMLFLVFAATGEAEYQTFGRIAVNEPPCGEREPHELKKAA